VTDQIKPKITLADLAAKFPLSLLSQLMPPGAVSYQLFTKDAITVPGNPMASVKAVGQGPDLESVTSEVVSRGLMGKPHAITMTVVLICRD
jgi:hypothetical protein